MTGERALEMIMYILAISMLGLIVYEVGACVHLLASPYVCIARHVHAQRVQSELASTMLQGISCKAFWIVQM